MRSTVFFLTAAVLAVLLLAARSGLTQLRDLGKTRNAKTATYALGALGTVRSALQVYYGENEGLFPTDNLACLTGAGKQLAAIPALWSGTEGPAPHPQGAEVLAYPSALVRDTGKFAYVNNPDDPAWGHFYIDCTHYGGRQPWSAY